MPCDSSHMEASLREVLMSQVCCLLDELKTGNPVDVNSAEWRGYHPRIYNKVSTRNDDALVAELCDKLTKSPIKEFSFEMQIWWRDHQKADRARIAKEKAEAQAKEEREKALAKLTLADRKALGVK